MYLLFLNDPENRVNGLLADFETDDLPKTLVDYLSSNNFSNELNFYYFASAILYFPDVEKLFSKEFIKNMRDIGIPQSSDYDEYDEHLLEALRIIEKEEGLLNYFDGLQLGNKYLVLVKDDCGVWAKLVRNGFYHE